MECSSNYLGQKFIDLKYSHLGTNSLFVDEKFPASSESISKLSKASNIFWKRPSEITKTPEFKSDKFNATDIATKFNN